MRQPLHAQVGMATLSGIVRDTSGAVIPNAQITLESMQEHLSRQTAANSTGAYVIPAILPGTYRLVVAAKGFQTQTFNNITLSSGQGSTVNATLQVGEAKAIITVTEKSPLLQTTTATMGATVTARKMTALPLRGRNFSSLLTTLPGVAPFDYSRENLSPGGTAINPPSMDSDRETTNTRWTECPTWKSYLTRFRCFLRRKRSPK